MRNAFTMISCAVLGIALVPLTAVPVKTEPVRWSVSDGWDIAYYPSTRGCLAFASFDGTAFFIGFDMHADVPALDITVLDDRWESIVPQKAYPVTLAFGDEQPWTLDMTGVFMDGAPGLNILIDTSVDKSAVFIEEFQRELRMTWSYGDFRLGQFTLRGSRRAFQQVLACQREYDAAARVPDSAPGNVANLSEE